jgi:Spy/CpxP family protein refolding chaperone
MNTRTTRSFLLFMIVAISNCAVGQTVRRVPAGSGNVGNMTTGSNSVPSGSGSVMNSNSNAANSMDPNQQNIWKVALDLGLTPDQRTQLESSVATYNDEHPNLDEAIHEARATLALALANGQTSLDVEIEGVVSANSKLQEADLKLWASLFAICTPNQQKQMLNMQTPLSQTASPPNTATTSQSQ